MWDSRELMVSVCVHVVNSNVFLVIETFTEENAFDRPSNDDAVKIIQILAVLVSPSVGGKP
jgi:hypothetical protein